jgi:hypothetical protein
MITIYQIHLSDADINLANSAGFESVPRVAARFDMQLGARKWKQDEYPQYYEATYEVDTDDLDEAFEATNLWEGPEVKRLKRGSSSSVGNIFVKDGDCFIVDNFGFANVGKIEGFV